MGQTNYVLKFSSRAAAQADAVAGLETILDDQGARQWLASNSVEVTIWRNSQDTVDGSGNVVHTPLSGFFVLISLDRVVDALLNHSAVQLVIDRDKMNARQPGFILKSGVSNAILQDLRISPIFAGMDVPWGVMN